MNSNKNSQTLNQVDAYRLAKSTIEDHYSTEEGKKFIHHLIYAYSIETPQVILYCKYNLYDCLTKSSLRPVSTKDEPLPREISNLYSKYMNIKEDGDEKSNLKTELDNQVKEYITSNQLTRLAYRSSQTNKILGLDELQALKDFIEDQIKLHNMTILKMMHHVNPDTYKLPKPKKVTKPAKKVSTKSDKFMKPKKDTPRMYTTSTSNTESDLAVKLSSLVDKFNK